MDDAPMDAVPMDDPTATGAGPAGPLALARTLLFVPGDRPERFGKALASGADAVVLDLEDAVAADRKAQARTDVARWLATRGGDAAATPTPVLVRINAAGTAAHADDLDWLGAAHGGVRADALMVAKAECGRRLHALHEHTGLPLVPLVESARGWSELAALAAAPAVLRLALGHIDFMADTGLRCGPDERELDPLRFALAMHTRLHGLAPAIDGVTTAFDDAARITADVRRALGFGFGGKLCIHPRQVPLVHAAMAPTAGQIERARRIVAADAASGGAAVQLDGAMIDRPVVLQARAVLARAALPRS